MKRVKEITHGRTTQVVVLALIIVLIAAIIFSCAPAANPAPTVTVTGAAPTATATVTATAKPAEGKAITLVAAYHLGGTTMNGLWGQAVMQHIREITKGRIQWEFYDNASLLKSPEQMDGVKNGIVDMSWMNPTVYPDRLPLHTLCDVPFLFDDVEAGWNALYDLERPIGTWGKETAKQGVYFLSFNAAFEDTIVNNKRQIATANDLKGLKFRATSQADAQVLNSLGVSTVVMTYADMLMALKTKAIDGVTTPSYRIKDSDLVSLAPYGTYLAPIGPYGVTLEGWIISIDALNKKLPPDLRDIVLNYIEKDAHQWDWVNRYGSLKQLVIDTGIPYIQKMKGTFMPFNKGEGEKVYNTLSSLKQNWYDKQDAAGKALYNEFFTLYEKYKATRGWKAAPAIPYVDAQGNIIQP